MSCYFRHIKDVLADAGIEVTPNNKKQVDRVIHDIVGIEYKDCSSTWAALKQQVLDNEGAKQVFIDRLRQSIGK